MNETRRQRTQMKVSKREEVDVTKIQDRMTANLGELLPAATVTTA